MLDTNLFSNCSILVGKVVTIDPSTWIITFMIPGVLENCSKFPSSSPLDSHNREVRVGDEILIIKPCSIQNDTFFYLPITIHERVGAHYKSNDIDIKDDGTICISTSKIVEITNGTIVIKLDGGSLTISGGTGLISGIETTTVDLHKHDIKFK